MTGASSGIGVETARALAAAGAEVTLAVRDIDAGHRIAADITAAPATPTSASAELDLADRASVAAFVAGWSGPLHLLINNAGVMAIPELERTPEGWELQFATNHLGHFALAARPARRARRRRRRADRVGELGRAPALAGHVRRPQLHSPPYDPWLAYGQSKTANILFAVEATRRWAGDGITANARAPGRIAETNLSAPRGPGVLERARALGRVRYKTIEQGAATSVLLAASPQLEGIGGRYFEDCNEAETLRPGPAEARPPASRPTRWTRGTPSGCGMCRSSCWAAPATQVTRA